MRNCNLKGSVFQRFTEGLPLVYESALALSFALAIA